MLKIYRIVAVDEDVEELDREETEEIVEEVEVVFVADAGLSELSTDFFVSVDAGSSSCSEFSGPSYSGTPSSWMVSLPFGGFHPGGQRIEPGG